MRLVDLIVRQGHLSERALAEALMTGTRPAHLDLCDICAERADRLGRWLDNVRQSADAATDAAFPAERLTAQQAQILRRLEQLDEPRRVISFPQGARSIPREHGERRRVAPAWVGVAAAAGLLIGIVGSQAAGRLSAPVQAPTPAVAVAQPAAPAVESAPVAGSRPSLLEMDFDYMPDELRAINDVTPSAIGTLAANGG